MEPIAQAIDAFTSPPRKRGRGPTYVADFADDADQNVSRRARAVVECITGMGSAMVLKAVGGAALVTGCRRHLFVSVGRPPDPILASMELTSSAEALRAAGPVIIGIAGFLRERQRTGESKTLQAYQVWTRRHNHDKSMSAVREVLGLAQFNTVVSTEVFELPATG